MLYTTAALRIGAVGAIVGGVIGPVANLLHPRESGSLDNLDVPSRGSVGFNLFLFGAIPILYGVAMLQSTDYAPWLGWVGVIFP